MSLQTVEETVQRGFAAHTAGRLAEALAIYGEVLDFNPHHADALNLSGSAKRSLGDTEGALLMLTRAVAAAPKRADIKLNLGNALSAARQYGLATELFTAALDLDPGYVEAAANLGVARVKLGDYPGGIAAYERALDAEPGHRVALHNLGNALAEMNRLDEAADILRRAIAHYPDLAEARYNLSLILLRLGDYQAGFAAYEARWRSADFTSPRRHTDITDWDGRPYAGKTLLVHAEQGLGDSLQFLRLLPMAKSLGGMLALEVPAALVRMARSAAGPDRIVGSTGEFGPVDLQSPMLGLPHRLRLTLGSVGMQKPYLSAEPERVEFWRQRLALRPGEKSIGFVWRGNPHSPADRGRSLGGAGELSPFGGLDGVRRIALQRLDREELEPSDTPSGWRVAGTEFLVEHPGPDFDTGADAFVDTAGLMMGLDLVVSVCTSPIHLAGALGRPAIVLLKAMPDWRWLMGRDDSPWYPSVRLARQERAGDFGPVVEQAAAMARRMLGLSSL